MDISSALLMFAIVQGLFFLVLVVMLYATINGRMVGFGRSLAKAKSLMEQRLVLEALAAGAGEPDLPSLLRSLGKHAADTLGYPEWIIWLRGERAGFTVAEASPPLSPEEASALYWDNLSPQAQWVTRNAAPLRLTTRIVENFITSETERLYERFVTGRLIPFIESERLIGFILLGGRRETKEERSEQFLDLFGAVAGVMIKKSLMDQQERALRHSRQRSESLARLGQLAAGLAHEVRNPLTFIKSTAQHVIKKYEFQPSDKELLAGMLEEINRINDLVNDLLVLGRIDAGGFTRIGVGVLMEKIGRFAERIAADCGVAFELTGHCGEAAVMGNEGLLRQLLMNLILNGIEATDEGGLVRVAQERKDEIISILVEDSGSGIAAEIRDKIFDPFVTTKDKGTGLGLTVSYSVARAHGGSLELLRSGGDGTCFRVTLPLSDRGQREGGSHG